MTIGKGELGEWSTSADTLFDRAMARVEQDGIARLDRGAELCLERDVSGADCLFGEDRRVVGGRFVRWTIGDGGRVRTSDEDENC
jgi:hypothetical protein